MHKIGTFLEIIAKGDEQWIISDFLRIRIRNSVCKGEYK